MTTDAAGRYMGQDNAQTVTDHRNLGIIYVYDYVRRDGKTIYGAIAYAGKATKNSFHYTYRTPEQRRDAIGQFFTNLLKHKQRVAERRAADFSGHSFKAGDIVTNSWGYDQTNVDWYRVTRTTTNYVWLMPICSSLLPDSGCGPMSGKVSIALDENLKPIDATNGKETKHRASQDAVTMRFGSGSKYTGGSLYESWYA